MLNNQQELLFIVVALALFIFVVYREKNYRENLVCDDTIGAAPLGYPMDWTTPGNPFLLGMYN